MKKGERVQQQCDVCGRWLDKNITNFKKYSRKTNGLNFHTTCRECEDHIKLNTEWKDGKLLCHICGEYKDPGEFTYAGAKSRAMDKSLPFTITKEDLLTIWKSQNGKCAISGLDMTYELGEGRTYTNVSIDQVLPSKGYTVDNIQLVCMAVNQLKSDLDMDTILTLCSAIVGNAAKWKH